MQKPKIGSIWLLSKLDCSCNPRKRYIVTRLDDANEVDYFDRIDRIYFRKHEGLGEVDFSLPGYTMPLDEFLRDYFPVPDDECDDAITLADINAAPRETYRNDFERDVRGELAYLGDILIEKNLAYGDSALNPVRIFSKANESEGIRVRLDDKLSRIRNDPNALNEDAILDLMGYLVLLKILEKSKKEDGNDE